MPPPPGLFVVERGPVDAPRVVLVHGSMDRSSGMRPVARRLQDELRVIAYDRRGYARSREVGGPFDLEHQVSDLVAILDGQPAVVFGHSLGGDIALAAAQDHPDLVPAVGAYEPPMPWEPWWPSTTAVGGALVTANREDPAAAAEAFLRRMVGDRTWERLPVGIRDERRADGPALVGEFTDLRRRAPYEAAEIRVPVLLARGEHTAPQHIRSAEVLASRFAGRDHQPGFEMVVVPDVGHGIHIEDPTALADLIRRLAAMVTAR